MKILNRTKEYRFFYHYNKQNKKMTIHFKKSCTIVNDVICNVPCETKWNKGQPNLVMRGFAKNVKIIKNKAIIE
jgi:hypothetical protein